MKFSRSAALLVLATSGCINPFAPAADIEIAAVNASGYQEMYVPKTTPTSRNAGWYQSVGSTQVNLILKNKVGAFINSVNLVFTDLAGNPVTTYRTTGGKTFRVLWRLNPKLAFSTLSDGEGNTMQFTFTLLDGNVYTELETQIGDTKVIVAHITFRGEDDNGYDVKLTGDVTIKGFGF